MTAEELRIGNYVMLHKGNGESYPYCMDAYDIYTVSESGCADISPIELRPSILEALGFQCKKYGFGTPFIYCQYEHSSGYYIGEKMNDLFDLSDKLVTTKITSVHLLQNLMYCLTKEELEVNYEKLKTALQ